MTDFTIFGADLSFFLDTPAESGYDQGVTNRPASDAQMAKLREIARLSKEVHFT